MTIIKIGVPGIIPDNDLQYITFMSRVIQRVDKDAQLTIIRGIRTYSYNIVPSDPKLKIVMMEEIILAHKVMGVPIQFSKTVAMSHAINFELL